MSCSRRAVLAGLLTGPAACGFAPADSVGGSLPRDRIAVDPVDSRDGFVLTGRLEERLGRPGMAGTWRLGVVLEVEEQAMALTTGNQIDRFNLVGRAEWRLVDTASGATVADGMVRDFTAWSATASTVATLAAERDAHRRLALALADAILADLTLALAGR
jgi:LPS-assembly lipoprotein